MSSSCSLNINRPTRKSLVNQLPRCTLVFHGPNLQTCKWPGCSFVFHGPNLSTCNWPGCSLVYVAQIRQHHLVVFWFKSFWPQFYQTKFGPPGFLFFAAVIWCDYALCEPELVQILLCGSADRSAEAGSTKPLSNSWVSRLTPKVSNKSICHELLLTNQPFRPFQHLKV